MIEGLGALLGVVLQHLSDVGKHVRELPYAVVLPMHLHLRRLRNELVHGGAHTVPLEDKSLTKQLIERLLLSELALTEKDIEGRPNTRTVHSSLRYGLVRGAPPPSQP